MHKPRTAFPADYKSVVGQVDPMDTISADELTKEYGENLAVNRLSLSVGS